MCKQMTLLISIMTISLIAINPGLSAMDGLVGAWLFDTGSGDVAIDASGNGHDGELMGNATWDENGKFGSALSFDATKAYVVVPDDEAFEFSGDFTLACWIQFEGVIVPSDGSGLINKGHGEPAASPQTPFYLLYLRPNGTISLFLRTAALEECMTPWSTATVSDGEWHHVVAMRDGDEIRTYIDGKEDKVAPCAFDATYGGNDQPLVLMVHANRFIDGLMDEVAIFDKALSEGEIAQLMGGLETAAVEATGKLSTMWGELKSKHLSGDKEIRL